jgi:plasmid maintenance system antidote protein VapI
MNEIVKNLLTGKDNVTHDIARWAWAIGFIAVIGIAVYEVLQAQHISLTELAEALGIVSGAGGASVMMKKDTEPTGDAQ